MAILKKGKYLQIAFNRSLSEVKKMISVLPVSDKILIEAGTPFIKNYGNKGINLLKNWWGEKVNNPYIIADMKCMDRGLREAQIATAASAITCLGLAPIETIDEFILNCKNQGLDSMIDMMNVPFPFEVLQKLKNKPDVVILHRGVDENLQNKEKEIPYHQIRQIRGTYDLIVSIAGGEDFRDVRRAIFNDADIAVVWRYFYENPQESANIAKEFLKEIR